FEEKEHKTTGDVGPPNGRYTVEQMKAISMFEEDFAPPSGQKHPIEKLQGINRPFMDTIRISRDGDTRTEADLNGHESGDKLNAFVKTAWDTFGTELSDAVTLINQQNQIQMNDINSLQKQKDRHFDLANNSLTKASEIIQSIGRNVA